MHLTATSLVLKFLSNTDSQNSNILHKLQPLLSLSMVLFPRIVINFDQLRDFAISYGAGILVLTLPCVVSHDRLNHSVSSEGFRTLSSLWNELFITSDRFLLRYRAAVERKIIGKQYVQQTSPSQYPQWCVLSARILHEFYVSNQSITVYWVTVILERDKMALDAFNSS